MADRGFFKSPESSLSAAASTPAVASILALRETFSPGFSARPSACHSGAVSTKQQSQRPYLGAGPRASPTAARAAVSRRRRADPVRSDQRPAAASPRPAIPVRPASRRRVAAASPRPAFRPIRRDDVGSSPDMRGATRRVLPTRRGATPGRRRRPAPGSPARPRYASSARAPSSSASDRACAAGDASDRGRRAAETRARRASSYSSVAAGL